MKDLEEVAHYIESIRDDLFSIYTSMENDLRGESNYIYLLRSRIKSPESTFIKLRRKTNQSLNDLTDILGVRAYCLYNNYIVKAHIDILKYLYSNKFLIKEINIYEPLIKGEKFEISLGDISHCLHGEFSEKNKEIIYTYDEKSRVIEINRSDKSSGYKSIHYIFEIKIGEQYIKCELQLRTILQDVWAEMEHNILYKKSYVHPHAAKLFENLSSDLEKVQEQIETIREIQDEELKWNEFFNDKVKQVFLHYDESFINIDDIMDASGATDLYQSYVKIARNDNFGKRSKDDIETLEKYLCNIEEKTNKIGPDNISYFFNMERAFIFMLQGKMSDAEDIYKKYIDKSYFPHDIKELYSVFFKYGEIKHISGDIIGSFISFDKCERLMENMPHVHPENKFFIYERLASIYWSLGTDYYETALEKINKSEEVYNKIEYLKSNDAYTLMLFNKMCWHNLCLAEKYMENGNENTVQIYMEKADEYYEKIVLLYENNNDSLFQNMSDTAAWFCYLKSKYISKFNPDNQNSIDKKESIKKYIIKSVMWSEEIIKDHMENRGTNPLRSISLHQKHIQEILKKKSDYKL